MDSKKPKPRKYSLSGNQCEILRMILKGMNRYQIAKVLNVNDTSVARAMKGARRQLGIPNASYEEAAKYAAKLRLL